LNKITIFIERDGVININSEAVNKKEDIEFNPHIFELLRSFKDHDYRVIVISDQNDVGVYDYPLNTDLDITNIHVMYVCNILDQKGQIDHIYQCNHVFIEDCACLMPNSTLIQRALDSYPDIDIDNSLMIGESWRAMNAASSLGIKTCFLISELQNLHMCNKEPDFCISDVLQASKLIPSYFKNKRKLDDKNS